MLDETVTTVSSDGKKTTISSDNNGALNGGTPVFDQVQTVAQQADGSILETVTDYSASGHEECRDRQEHGRQRPVLDADPGRERRRHGRQHDETGTVVLNANGSTTETFTDSNGALNSSHDGKTDSTTAVTTTQANGLSKTIVITGMNDDYSDSNTVSDTKVIDTGAGNAGGTTETIAITVPGTSGARDTETVNVSANGLSQTTQLSVGGYNIHTDAAQVALDGSKTETVTLLNPDGSLYEKDVTWTSANGQSATLQSARGGSTGFNHFENVVTNLDGGTTNTIWDFSASQAIACAVVTTASASGLGKTVQIETAGGVLEQTLSAATVLNADGGTTETQSVLNANGTLRSQEIRTASASGLNITTTYDVNGDGTVDETTTDAIVLNTDGSKTETVTTAYGAAGGTQKSQSVTTTSANGLNVSTTLTVNGYAKVADTVAISASGIKTETVQNYSISGTSATLVTSTVTTTSADGRDIVVQHKNSAGTVTSTDTTLTTAGANGSYQWTDVKSSGTVLDEANHFIDANGVDGVTLYVGTTKYTATLSVAQETSLRTMVTRLYATLLDRAPTAASGRPGCNTTRPAA